MVYVVNKYGKPLMPTNRYGHVRKLLKAKLAVPICNNPFTIRLKYDTDNITQSLTLGIDTGRENIGLCVSDENGRAVFLANVETKNKQVTKNMSERKSFRQARRKYRRQRKQRKAIKYNLTIKNGVDSILRNKKPCKEIQVFYPGMEKAISNKVIKGKEAKFNNRVRPEGWLTPSARNLIQIHVNLVKKIQYFLPITNIVVEHNVFDFQKLENGNIKNWEYQQGLLYGFKDYKDYIYKQQNSLCLLCNSKHIEHYHHVVPRHSGGSDTSSNFVGLCEDCHSLVHKDNSYMEELKSLKQGLRKKYEIGLLNSCMGLIIESLSNLLPTTTITGYETKNLRTNLSLDKDHYIDAYIISIYSKEISTPNIDSKVYQIRHFKKKNNNIISQLGSRKYFYNGKLVATNRHKAMEQKIDSLEEYLDNYSKSHSKEELDRHFRELEVKPATRVYTFHKQCKVPNFKCGDLVKNLKTGEVGIAIKVRPSVSSLELVSKRSSNFKYCKLLSSESLVFV